MPQNDPLVIGGWNHKSKTDDRLYVTVAYKPSKGSRRRATSSSFKVEGTTRVHLLAERIKALLEADIAREQQSNTSEDGGQA